MLLNSTVMMYICSKSSSIATIKSSKHGDRELASCSLGMLSADRTWLIDANTRLRVCSYACSP